MAYTTPVNAVATRTPQRPERRRDLPGAESRGEWSRVVWLDRQVRDGQFPNAAALQEEFTIGRRTAFETITFLRDSLGAPLVYRRERRGYLYTDPTYALPSV